MPHHDWGKGLAHVRLIVRRHVKHPVTIDQAEANAVDENLPRKLVPRLAWPNTTPRFGIGSHADVPTVFNLLRFRRSCFVRFRECISPEKIFQMRITEYDDGPVAFQPEVMSSRINEVCLSANRGGRGQLVDPVFGRHAVGDHAAYIAGGNRIFRLRIPYELVVVHVVPAINGNRAGGYAAGLRAFVSVRQAKLDRASLFAGRQTPGGTPAARQRDGQAARQQE